MNRKDRIKLYSKNSILSIQHVFAMMGATILVPIITGLSISMTLVSAGLGTILFHFITKRKVPVFLGSSFAFVGAILTVMKSYNFPKQGTTAWFEAMGKISIGLVFAGLMYFLIALVVRTIGVSRIKKLLPPIVIGPVIMVIGINLAPVVFNNFIKNSYKNPINPSITAGKIWAIVIVTVLVIIAISGFMKKGFINSIAVLIGMGVGYLLSLILKVVDFNPIINADWIIFQKNSISLYSYYKYMTFDIQTIILFVPLSLVTCLEHIGDISVNSAITGNNYIVDPGLHRTLTGDGAATILAGFLGGPANTTYGENTAILAITKNYNPNIIALAGVFSLFLGIFGKFGGFIASIPLAVVGGASLLLFGMIAANGLKVIVEDKVDFTRPRNVFTVSLILVIGIGMSATNMSIKLGKIEISPLAFVTILGILVNQLFMLSEKLIGTGSGNDKEKIEELEKESIFEYRE